jgi:polysaccharide biosynthesis protein PslH
MKILLVTPHLPYPPQQGAAIRNYHILRWLTRTHEVSLLTFAPEGLIPKHLLDLCASVRTVQTPPKRMMARRLRDLARSGLPDLALRLKSNAMKTALRNWLALDRFDAVHVECLETTADWLALLEAMPPGDRPFTVFDNHNAEYLLQWRAFQTDVRFPKRWPGAAYSLAQSWKLRRYERRLCASHDRIIFVSEEDRRSLVEDVAGSPSFVIPNGVDCAYYPFQGGALSNDAGGQIIFTGTMDFRPNVDAVVWFCREVLPRVRARVPNVSFVIVGKSPTPVVQALAGEYGVVVTGAVDDVRPYMSQASVYAIPMRMGGGVRLKALEAMAFGLPVVSTSLGCAGIEAVPGEHFLLADSPVAFAAQITGLLAAEYRSPAAHNQCTTFG